MASMTRHMVRLCARSLTLRYLAVRRSITTTACRAVVPRPPGKSSGSQPKKKPKKTSRTPLAPNAKPKPKSEPKSAPWNSPGEQTIPKSTTTMAPSKTPKGFARHGVARSATIHGSKNPKNFPHHHFLDRQHRIKRQSEKRGMLKAGQKPKPAREYHRRLAQKAMTPKTPAHTPPAHTTPKPPPKPKPKPPTPGLPTPPSISYLPPPSNDPSPTAIPAAPPPPAALAAATAVFTARPPLFVFAAPRFLNLPPNTTTPEICVLGRSNVGKSTLINAIGGLNSAQAGHAHGLAARRAQLAITSKRAGCTTTMNGYAFGGVVGSTLRQSLAAREEENRKLAAGQSRGERREEANKLKERLPAGRLLLVDMPGYGMNSRNEWGVEIEKYLRKRKMLKAAVVLVDVKAGVKDGDRQALQLLRNARVRTMVVLTKADKVGYGAKGIDKACLEVWKELRRVEGRGLNWGEGDGWETEIWVTGAGDPTKNGGLGVEGARWAICKTVGLTEEVRKSVRPVVVEEKKEVEAPKIVPFDQINWGQFAAPSGQEEKPAAEEKPVVEEKPAVEEKQVVEEKPVVEKKIERITSMDALEKMAMEISRGPRNPRQPVMPLREKPAKEPWKPAKKKLAQAERAVGEMHGKITTMEALQKIAEAKKMKRRIRNASF